MPPKKRPRNLKNKNWVQLTKNFVKEWPDVLEGLSFTSMPIKYLKSMHIYLKNSAMLVLDVEKEVQRKKESVVATWCKQYVERNYRNIKTIDLKFDVPKLRADMESKTAKILNKTFNK